MHDPPVIDDESVSWARERETSWSLLGQEVLERACAGSAGWTRRHDVALIPPKTPRVRFVQSQ